VLKVLSNYQFNSFKTAALQVTALEALLDDIILRNWPPLDEPLEIVAWSGDQQRALIDKHHVQPHTLASRASRYIHHDPQGQQCLEMKETMTS
jgi:hypothetical protein